MIKEGPGRVEGSGLGGYYIIMRIIFLLSPLKGSCIFDKS
jgi:hypothetical protein